MVVLLALVTFALFVVIDLTREQRRNKVLMKEGEALQNAVAATEPEFVAGFKMPPVLKYHQGHMWVHQVAPDVAYVGMDDFARRLTGRYGRFTTPRVGEHLAQGQPAVGVTHNGDRAKLLSPVGGEVVGVNPHLKDDPDLPHKDCYGRGWLYKIRSPHLFKDLNNLFGGSLAHKWMEDTRDRLQYRLMLASGSVLQDGGAPVEDLGGALDSDEWKSMVDEFLTLRNTVE